MAVDGSLKFDTKIDTMGFTKGTNTIRTQADSLKRTFVGLGKVMLTAFSIKKGFDIGKQAIGIASDLQEVQNVVDTAFGDMAYKMEEFANTSIETFGISKLAAKEMGSLFMAMSKGMGQMPEVASNMAVSITGRLADIMSFYNKTAEEVQTIGKAIYTGETEPLKGIGLVATETNLALFALQNGFKTAYKDMASNEKLLVRQQYFLAQTSLAAGDFAKTSDSWANQTRVLGEKWKEFLGIMGSGLIQVLSPTVKFLGTALTSLTRFASIVGNVLSDVFGFEKQAISAGDATLAIGTGTDEASAGITGLGDSVEDASKKINKSLSPIDELNNMTSSLAENSNLGNISIDAPTGSEVDSQLSDLGEDNSKVSKLSKIVGNFAEKLKGLWDTLAPFVGGIGKGLTNFISVMVELLTPAVSLALDGLSTALSWLSTTIKKIPEDVLIAIGGAIGGLITAILIFNTATAVVGIVKNIGKAISGMLALIAMHPVAAIALAIAALAGGILALNKAKFDRSAVGKYIEKIDELVESSDRLNEEVDEMLENADDRRRDIKNEYGAIEILAEKYFDLADQQSLTNDEQELLKAYAEELIKKIPELNGLIDEQTGAYKGTKEEINLLITASKELTLVQAAQESLTETGKLLYEQNKKLNELETTRIETNRLLTEKQSDLDDAYAATNASMEDYQAYLDGGGESVVTLTKEVNKLEKAQDTLDAQIGEAKTGQQNLNKEWDYAVDYIKTYSTDAKKAMAQVEKSVLEAYTNIDKDIRNWKLPDLIAAIKVDSSALTEFYKSQQIPVGIGIVTAPHLASGTVVPANYGNYMAVLGDNKREPEIVSPLSTMEQAMENVLNRKGNNSSNGEIHIHFDGEAKGLFKLIRKAERENYNITGDSIFVH